MATYIREQLLKNKTAREIEELDPSYWQLTLEETDRAIVQQAKKFGVNEADIMVPIAVPLQQWAKGFFYENIGIDYTSAIGNTEGFEEGDRYSILRDMGTGLKKEYFRELTAEVIKGTDTLKGQRFSTTVRYQ